MCEGRLRGAALPRGAPEFQRDMSFPKTIITMVTVGLFSLGWACAGEWAEWGGGPHKNMVSAETGLPIEISG